MGLPWVRLDANIAGHDKTLRALAMPGGKAAMAVMQFAVAWSGGQGTDGLIPTHALPAIHATPKDVAILVAVGFWEPDEQGWRIHNFATRQELKATTTAKRDVQRKAAIRTNCIRWHGRECGCWKSAAPPSVRLIK